MDRAKSLSGVTRMPPIEIDRGHSFRVPETDWTAPVPGAE